MIRKALPEDIIKVAQIYDEILSLEEEGKASTGWIRNVYPTADTAKEALSKDELFVDEENGIIVASAKINREQVEEYKNCRWKYSASDDEVMVLHTLTVSPSYSGKGTATRFVSFYEEYALKAGCRVLRMDTNKINLPARALYKKLGYIESGIVDCEFNGIPGVKLVCLEKELG